MINMFIYIYVCVYIYIFKEIKMIDEAKRSHRRR